MISFFYVVGLSIRSNAGSSSVDLVDVEISKWSGKHTYTINDTGEAFYKDIALLCAKDGIRTERYLVAFSPKVSVMHSSYIYEWDELINADSGWYNQENKLKAPCRNGYINSGQEREGIAVRVYVVL